MKLGATKMANLKEMFKKRLAEDAVEGSVSATDIVSTPYPMLAATELKRVTNASEVPVFKYKKKKKKGLKEYVGKSMNLKEEDLSVADIVGKLRHTQRVIDNKSYNRKTFGIEDDKGRTVKISIRAEDAERFEAVLSDIVDRDNPPPIAQIIYELKDDIDILDVKWPNVIENDEDISSKKPTDDDVPKDTESPTDDDKEGSEANEDMPNFSEGPVDPNPDESLPRIDGADGDEIGTETKTSDDGDTKNLLKQVIDMLRADADARKADAQARESEARARESESALRDTRNKVAQEEQLLDLETKASLERIKQKEIRRQAQLKKATQKLDNVGSDQDDVDLTDGGNDDFNIPSDEEAKTMLKGRPGGSLPVKGMSSEERGATGDIGSISDVAKSITGGM